MQLKNKIRTGVIGTVLALAATVALPAPAYAGIEMNRHYPWIHGCQTDQQLAHSTGVWDKYGRYVGQVRIYWSNRCVTNWVQIAPNNPNGMGIAASIVNRYGDVGEMAKNYTTVTAPMLYSPPSDPCINVKIIVSSGPWSNSYNDPAPIYTIC